MIKESGPSVCFISQVSISRGRECRERGGASGRADGVTGAWLGQETEVGLCFCININHNDRPVIQRIHLKGL